MQKISSKDNEKIRYLRKLSQKKYREKFGEFFVENLKIIQDAGVAPKAIFATDKKVLEKLQADEKYLISAQINKSFSNLDTPSGIVALYKKEQKPIDFSSKIVYLNRISDPGNLGTILRTALAFGFKNIIVDEGCADIYNPKTVQAAKDAIFKVNIAEDKNLKLLKEIKKNMPIVSARLEGGKDPEKFARKKICLVLGSESHGVDKAIEKLSDDFIKIKISKEIESLNVAIAAGIILYSI
ncbi:RNA methyltransferase [Patescibacteria group bacterium]|nr:RNA methyltransferase [Patescibacteria group bacterium]